MYENEIFYCVKCKSKRTATDVKRVITSNHKHALKGKCSVCGTTVMKFIKKS